MDEFDDEKVRKNDILSNRDKAQRRLGQSMDGTGLQVDEYKDIHTNRRPKSDALSFKGRKNRVRKRARHAIDPSR